MNISTINCNGLHETTKIEYIDKFLKDNMIDICFTQETHLNDIKHCRIVERKLNAKCYWSLTDKNRSAEPEPFDLDL